MDLKSTKHSPQQKKNSWQDYLKVIGLALFLAFGVRTFLFQPFTIPSGSMIPTLQMGDYLFVSKYSYGYSRFSLPFHLSFIKGRYFARTPQRGDVVVFHPVSDAAGADYYVKRVVGLPGDTVQMRYGLLYVNGQAVGRSARAGANLSRLGFAPTFSHNNEPEEGGVEFQETLPENVSFTTLKTRRYGPLDNTPCIRVPKGHFFAMGDNRDNSSDSRVFGPVPLENLVGKAQFILFSIQKTGGQPAWKHGLKIFRWHRFFHRIV